MDGESWIEIEDLFAEAAPLDPARRAALFDARCAGRPQLRREVESLLSSHDELGNFLHVALPAETRAAEPPRDAEAQVGRVVGHYRLVGLIASGGMGNVFRAEDLALGREAAVKLLPQSLASDLRRTVLAEAEASAMLQHPAIATHYEAGEADGETFIAMEFVRGRTLRDRLKDGSLPFNEAIAIATRLLEALAHAHAAGLLHRDIKPENVMLVEPTVAKLLDFGIAVPLSATGDTPRAGTIGYLAPEQVAGRALDARTDLFQVGLLLYEMLTGRPAFESESRLERLAAAMSVSIDLDVLDTVSMPAAIAAIVRRALASEPAERYGNAASMAAELTLAARSTASGSAPDLASQAHEYFARARLLIDGFGKGSLEDARELLERTIAIDDRHVGALAALATTYGLRAIASPNRADYERAAAYGDRALAIDNQHVPALVWKSYALSALGRHAEAEAALQRALTIDPNDSEALYFAAGVHLFWHSPPEVPHALARLQRAVERDRSRGMWWLALGTAHLFLGHHGEALSSFSRAEELEATPSRFNTAGAAAYAGEALRRLNRLDEARAAAFAGLESAERSDHAYRDTFRAHALTVIGRIALDQRHQSAAEAAFQQVLAQARGRPRPRASGHFVVHALCGLTRATRQESFLDDASRLSQSRDTFDFGQFYGALEPDTVLELALTHAALGREADAQAWMARARAAGAHRHTSF